MLLIRAEEFVNFNDMRTVDLVHKEDFLPQSKVTSLSYLRAIFFYLELGNDLGGKYTLYMVLYNSPVSVTTSLIWIDIIGRQLVVTALKFVL